jgi:hypothetical protein
LHRNEHAACPVYSQHSPEFGLAAKFVENFPVHSYMLVDAEPMLDIARRFLLERFGARGEETFRFYQGYPKDHECDFVIATNCLGEMDDKSIRKYFDFIQSNLVPGGVFYSNNIESSFYDYPWDDHWDFLLKRYWGHTVVETIAVRNDRDSCPASKN